jgi:hypothetical protein
VVLFCPLRWDAACSGDWMRIGGFGSVDTCARGFVGWVSSRLSSSSHGGVAPRNRPNFGRLGRRNVNKGRSSRHDL